MLKLIEVKYRRCSGMECGSDFGCRDEPGRCPWEAESGSFLCSHCATVHVSVAAFIRSLWAAWQRARRAQKNQGVT